MDLTIKNYRCNEAQHVEKNLQFHMIYFMYFLSIQAVLFEMRYTFIFACLAG